uniref:PEAK1 related, kinase-activating pseudokinase 1 n=1 Tax=Leptobrachium leishanense TaxID=445787 RepID=A0A8C5LP18_9ANUR
MLRAITLRSESLKMPVCNEFVEHIWKPGSCKNCFHPRSAHRNSSVPSDGKAGNVPALHGVNGIRNKTENPNQEDDIVTAALYSKPTIAVKPTMIASDTAEMWEELNGTETLTQVSWKLSSTSNTVLKSGDMPRVLLENLKPFNPNRKSPSDNASKYIFNGLQSPEKNMEIHAVNNLTYVSHFGGQADKATFIKEKLPISFDENKQVSSSGSQSPVEQSPRGTLLSRESTGYRHSGKSGTALTNQVIQDQTRSARDIKLKNCLNNCESGSNTNLHFSKINMSIHSESDGKSDKLSYISVKDIPAASPTSSHTFEFHLPKGYRQTLVAQSHQFTHKEACVQLETQGNQNEPIYAESTKRKGVLGRNGIVTKTEDRVENNGVNEETRPSEDKQQSSNNERMYQESMTHVSAKITVMAAHTEEDNRTIYLSSPDSAVGVQWACNSPSTTESSSPVFFWGEKSHDAKSVEVSKSYNIPLSHKNQGDSSPFSPSLSTKSDELINRRISSPTHAVGILSYRKETLDSHDRCLPSGDRRRFYQAMKSRQCRIDEEEEEETGVTQQSRTTAMGNGPLVKAPTVNNHDSSHSEENYSRKGMSKSASCPVELSKGNEIEETSQAPPPPPKKLPRSPPKLTKSSTEPGTFSLGSVESLGESFKATNLSNSNTNVCFSTGSIDSLDSKTCSEGGQSFEALNSPTAPVGEKKPFEQVSQNVDSSEGVQNGSLQPPPLPVKKSINRLCSAPDNSAWSRANLPRNGVNPITPKLTLSQSEGNICGDQRTLTSCPLSPGDKNAIFSSSESLEKCCRGIGHRNEIRNRNCLQTRVTQSVSTSELTVSGHASSGSSLQLHHLLSNIDSKEGMYAKLSGLYAQSTRRLMNKCEDVFMRDQKKEMHFNENNWSLFKLSSNKPCCNAGDAIYYCATCAKDLNNKYAVKMCRTEDTKTSYCSLSLPVHYNIQQDCGHFVATVPSSMLNPPDVPKDCPANECSQPVPLSREEECVVVITREVPYCTAADFVKESVSIHKAQPEVYERQVCLLLLQLCNGLEHLKEHGIIHRDLCLENLLLVHCQTSPNKVKDGKYVPRLIVSNFSKAKQRPGSEVFRPRRDKTRLAPEIMVASQYKKFDEFQAGILIYELLHQSNPFESRTSLQEQEYTQKDLPSLSNLSVYSRGLQHLAHLLLEADPIKRIRISESKRVLQCLLWGPRKDLTDQPFSHEEALHCALQNWIDMKRALLTMKFAENALDPEHNISLEDWLCCQYLASADPCYLYKTLKLIKLI